MSSSTPASSAPPPAPPAPTPSTSTSVKRACDACHRRKVKCDGLSPCRNCSSAQLACTYNAIPQKKGPKGSRAKVISELREQNRQSVLSNKAHNRLNNGVGGPMQPCAPSLAPTPGLLSNEIVKECIDFFFTNMYPTMPILHRQKLEQQARFADRDIDTYCLLTSLCALMMIQPGMPIPGDPLGLDSMPGANLMSGTMLMEETLRVRKGYDHLESPTLGSLATSYFLFGCYFGLDLHNKAWFHLREATTLAHILGMNKEETYMNYDIIDSSRRRRLYWLLFVTERSYALQRHRPLTLQAVINLPTAADDPTEPSPPLTGFIHLVTLFRPFDDMFVALWNKTRTDCSPSYLSALQKQLADALPTYLNSTESQAAELRISQQWLRTMVWQLSIQNGCLSSGNDNPSMTFQYPLEISRDLIAMTSGFSQHAMEVHGVGLVEKLFDVACSLTDVLSVSPPPTDPFAPSPADYLTQFLSLLSSLRNGDARFLPLLLTKIHDVLPRLVTPMLQTLPEPPAMGGGADIFDGFGNAGMGVATMPPQQQQYETKPYDPKQHFEGKRIEDVTSPTHQDPIPIPHSHNHGHTHPHTQHTQHTQHAQHAQHGLPHQQQQQQQQSQPLGQEPLPPFQHDHQQPPPYQTPMHAAIEYAPMENYAYMPPPQPQPARTPHRPAPPMRHASSGIGGMGFGGMQQGRGEYGGQQQGQQGLQGLQGLQHGGGLGGPQQQQQQQQQMVQHDGGFDGGLGMVGGEHLQYR